MFVLLSKGWRDDQRREWVAVTGVFEVSASFSSGQAALEVIQWFSHVKKSLRASVQQNAKQKHLEDRLFPQGKRDPENCVVIKAFLLG